MAVFSKRPLAFICFLSIALTALSLYLQTSVCYAIILASLILAVLAAIFAVVLPRIKVLKSKSRVRRISGILAILAVFFIIFSLLMLGRYDFFGKKRDIAREYSGKDCNLTFRIENVDYSHSYAERLSVRIKDIDGENVNMLAKAEFDAKTGYKSGDVLTAVGRIDVIGKDESYFVSDGYTAKITSDALNVTNVGTEKETLLEKLSSLNAVIQGKLDNSLGEDESSLVGAVLLGNREKLPDNIERDFRRSGISHMLALSGLHLTIIIGFFEFFMIRLRISKSVRCFALSLITLFYLALTGFSFSALRAAIMLGAVYFSYLLHSDSDSVTALFASVTLIIIVFPSALAGIGLWMSFLATLGVVVTSEMMSGLTFKLKKKPIPYQIMIKLFISISITVAAVIMIMAFSWLVFGEISLITPLSNLLFTPIISAVLLLGVIFIIVCPITFLSTVVAYPLGLISRAMLWTAGRLSHIYGVCVSLAYDFVPYIVIPLLVCTLIFLLFKIRRKYLIAVPVVLSLVAFSVCLIVSNSARSGKIDAVYLKSENEKNEMITVSVGNTFSVCDISSGGYANFDMASDEFDNFCVTEIENVILTHYHNYHVSATERFCRRNMVRNLILPLPEGEAESVIYEELCTVADSLGVNVITYKRGDATTIGKECSVTVSPETFIERSKQPIFYVRIDGNKDSLEYYSSVYYEVARPENYPEYVIFGAHGPNVKYKIQNYYFNKSVIHNVLIADGNMISPDFYIKDANVVVGVNRAEYRLGE